VSTGWTGHSDDDDDNDDDDDDDPVKFVSDI
jgi:hypothetical protein